MASLRSYGGVRVPSSLIPFPVALVVGLWSPLGLRPRWPVSVLALSLFFCFFFFFWSRLSPGRFRLGLCALFPAMNSVHFCKKKKKKKKKLPLVSKKTKEKKDIMIFLKFGGESGQISSNSHKPGFRNIVLDTDTKPRRQGGGYIT
jgi:hypothetical protein